MRVARRERLLPGPRDLHGSCARGRVPPAATTPSVDRGARRRGALGAPAGLMVTRYIAARPSLRRRGRSHASSSLFEGAAPRSNSLCRVRSSRASAREINSRGRRSALLEFHDRFAAQLHHAYRSFVAVRRGPSCPICFARRSRPRYAAEGSCSVSPSASRRALAGRTTALMWA